MKSIHIILVLLGITLFISKGNAQENNDSTYYFLLDRDTKLISYYEELETRKGIKGIFRRYDFWSDINSDLLLYISLTHFSEMDLIPGKVLTKPLSFCASLFNFNDSDSIPNKILIKPLSFLDSIRYYDEKWLTETKDLMFTHNLDKHTLYVIDKSTIKNDSITLFQVRYYSIEIDE